MQRHEPRFGPEKKREGVIVIPRRSRSPCPGSVTMQYTAGTGGRLFHRPTASRPYEKGFRCQDTQDQGRRLLLPIAVPVFPLNLRCTWAAKVAFCLSRSRLRRPVDQSLRMRCDDHRDLVLCSGVDEAGASCCLERIVNSQRCRSKAQKPTISLRYRYQSQARDPKEGRRRSRARQGGSVRDTAWHQFPSDRDHLPVVALIRCYVVAPR
jgi:hypothetical protein